MPASETAPKRYAFEHHRPGEVFYTPHGIIETNAIDGGAGLTAEQKGWFEKTGVKLRPVAAQPPKPEPPETNDRAQRRIAENKAIAEAQALEEQRVSKAQAASAAATGA